MDPIQIDPLSVSSTNASQSSPPSNGDTIIAANLESLTIEDAISQLQTVSADGSTPPHLSHDPQNNLKRGDPFQFGSRLLSEEDNVYEFNAWDHVETDDTYKEYAELQYAKQREAPVSDFDKSMLTSFSSSPSLAL